MFTKITVDHLEKGKKYIRGVYRANGKVVRLFDEIAPDQSLRTVAEAQAKKAQTKLGLAGVPA